MRRLLATTAVLALGAGIAAAQGVIELEEITVTANRVPTATAATGASVAVLTEADLADAAGDELIEVLRRLPGVSVTQTGPLGSGATVRIRGADARYIAVYIDGIRVSDPTLTESKFDFGGLTGADIARVELVRGSQSALYGGSAVGGVISITTKRAEREGLSQHARLEAGSYGTLAGSYGFTRGGPDGEVALTLSHIRSDGFSAADENDGNTEADGHRGTRLSFSARHRLSDTVTLGGAAFVQTSRSEYDGFDASFTLTDRDNVFDREEWGARAFAEIATGRTDHVFDLSLYDTRRRFDEEGDVSVFDGQRLALSWQATTGLSEALTLVWGGDWTEERARYDNLPAGEERARIAGAFAQALWAPSAALDVSASLRVDATSNFGAFASGRLAVAWRPDETLTLRGAVARGFRPPSIDERFGDYPGFFPFVGNPDLTPEESLSYELGVEKAFAGGARVSATLFALEIDNLITYVFGAPSTLENLPGTSTRAGLELEAELPLGEALTADLAYTYTDARRPSGARLDLVPWHEVELGLTAGLAPRLEGRISARHVAGVVEFGAPHPAYTVVGLGLDYALTDAVDLSLRVENLFDEEYQEVRGYGTSDRAFYVGLSGSF
ncbi:MAG: TonB-dependent receptor [Rhodobacteraceae bacterium]|nr:TonB-dependent receptor [Paracoccaceae bacterium]